MKSIRALVEDLDRGRTTARALVEECLTAIDDPSGEGSRAFISVDAERSLVVADGYDAIRAGGGAVPPFAGIPVAVKDLFDVAGQVTTAGSVVLADQPPAERDAPTVARLRAAGFIVIGRTNMTEFAYSGLGLNAHYDTPRSAFDRVTGRVPGGSSSGSGVAVADGMAAVALGTDTGGSCRIPAAFNGVVGFKPTAKRITVDGITPLSFSLDSAGPLGQTVDCCAIVDDLMAGGDGMVDPEPVANDRLRLGALSELVLDKLDDEVASAYEEALKSLASAGISITEVDFPEIYEVPHLYRHGGLIAAEAWAFHRELIERRGDEYDQRVSSRIQNGARTTAEEYIEAVVGRRRLMEIAARRLAGFDAFVMPTVPIMPPSIASFDDDDRDYYTTQNVLTLRNTSVGNFLDTCAVSIPVGGPPVGLMLMGAPMGDRQLLAAARTVEVVINS